MSGTTAQCSLTARRSVRVMRRSRLYREANVSTAAYIFAIAVYLSVGVPASRTVANPIEGVDTREDQVEALRLLSAGNTIIIVLLGAVLVMQVRVACSLGNIYAYIGI